MANETHNSVSGSAQVGTVVQARSIGQLHQHVHEAAADHPVPRQLPPEPAHFEDRKAEQARVSRAVEDWRGQGGPLVVALSGLGGIGKTTLGFRIARALLERCPDGVLYVDLDDLRRDGAVEVSDALGDLLRSLGVGAAWLERSFAGRTKQYWTYTQGKRLVVILDNVRYGAEATPLLPSSAAAVAIVISHGPLYDLEGAAAVEVPLGPLATDDAVRLLRSIVDDPRMTAEPEAAQELARECAGLPSALQVAGQWLRKYRRRSLSRLVAELTTELHEKGLPVVEAVWDAAYAGLGPEAALLYRLLPHHPAPVITPQAAAALLGESLRRGEDALEELEGAGLLESRPAGLGMHDLLRGHARRRGQQEAVRGEAEQGRRRLVRWYRRQAHRADVLAAGARLAVAPPVAELGYAEDVEFAGKHEALRWMESERHALYGCVRLAYEDGLDEDVWALCESLWTHFLDHPHYSDVVDAFGSGVAAATRAGNLTAMVRMRCQLARPLWEQERYEEAARELQQATSAAKTLGDSPQERKLRASAVEFSGILRLVQGDWVGAASQFEAARLEHLAIGNDYGVLLQTYLLGKAAVGMGELDRGAGLLEEAHAAAAALGRERMTARTGFELGRALQRLGRWPESGRLYEAALASARSRESAVDEVRVLEALADLSQESGDTAAAGEHRAAAREVRERSGGRAR